MMYCGCKENEEVDLIIDDHNNDRYYFKVNKKQTITDVKQKLKEELDSQGKNFEVDKCILYLKRDKLENQRTLEDYKIGQKSKNCLLYLIYGKNIKG